MATQPETLLTRGIHEIVVTASLDKKLTSSKALRIKYGIDPTGDLIHLGHAVPLLKLRELQDLGHTIILLIGDFTARIGDPTGKNKTRVPLSDAQISVNMANYLEQAALILDIDKTEVRYNSEWYSAMSAADLIGLMTQVTASQVGQRADFQKRLEAGEPISLQEYVYPVLQGYDSVVLKADVEMGGTDQTFNLLMGRQLQERYNQAPQDVITTPLLEGLDGSDKMSKSLGNFIALTDAPEDMYGKVMSIPDALLWKYFALATRIPETEVNEMTRQIEAGTLNPRDAKMYLGRDIVTRYHGAEAAVAAEGHFIDVFQKGAMPEEIAEIALEAREWNILDLLVVVGFAKSKSEARTLVDQNSVSVDEAVIADQGTMFTLSTTPILVKKGKRYFVKVVGR